MKIIQKGEIASIPLIEMEGYLVGDVAGYSEDNPQRPSRAEGWDYTPIYRGTFGAARHPRKVHRLEDPKWITMRDHRKVLRPRAFVQVQQPSEWKVAALAAQRLLQEKTGDKARILSPCEEWWKFYHPDLKNFYRVKKGGIPPKLETEPSWHYHVWCYDEWRLDWYRTMQRGYEPLRFYITEDADEMRELFSLTYMLQQGSM